MLEQKNIIKHKNNDCSDDYASSHDGAKANEDHDHEVRYEENPMEYYETILLQKLEKGESIIDTYCQILSDLRIPRNEKADLLSNIGDSLYQPDVKENKQNNYLMQIFYELASYDSFFDGYITIGDYSIVLQGLMWQSLISGDSYQWYYYTDHYLEWTRHNIISSRFLSTFTISDKVTYSNTFYDRGFSWLTLKYLITVLDAIYEHPFGKHSLKEGSLDIYDHICDLSKELGDYYTYYLYKKRKSEFSGIDFTLTEDTNSVRHVQYTEGIVKYIDDYFKAIDDIQTLEEREVILKKIEQDSRLSNSQKELLVNRCTTGMVLKDFAIRYRPYVPNIVIANKSFLDKTLSDFSQEEDEWVKILYLREICFQYLLMNDTDNWELYLSHFKELVYSLGVEVNPRNSLYIIDLTLLPEVLFYLDYDVEYLQVALMLYPWIESVCLKLNYYELMICHRHIDEYLKDLEISLEKEDTTLYKHVCDYHKLFMQHKDNTFSTWNNQEEKTWNLKKEEYMKALNPNKMPSEYNTIIEEFNQKCDEIIGLVRQDVMQAKLENTKE